MTEYEQEFLDKTKKYKEISSEDFEEIKNKEMPEEDRAALRAVLALRASLGEENKNKEPQALWRFIRYLTEIEMPMKIIDFTAILFPNNEEYFANTLPQNALRIVQRQAKFMLENKAYRDEEHKCHLEKIINNELPYGYTSDIKED